MPWSAYQLGGARVRSSAVFPERRSVRWTRSYAGRGSSPKTTISSSFSAPHSTSFWQRRKLLIPLPMMISVGSGPRGASGSGENGGSATRSFNACLRGRKPGARRGSARLCAQGVPYFYSRNTGPILALIAPRHHAQGAPSRRVEPLLERGDGARRRAFLPALRPWTLSVDRGDFSRRACGY